MSTSFALDPRLAADTHPLARWPLCEVQLMDDARYPVSYTHLDVYKRQHLLYDFYAFAPSFP